MSKAKPLIICLAGPTASGKTDVAVEISKKIPCEIISCDSMQVYRSMPALTQAPSKKILQKCKTHLVGFLKPEEEFNAALFCEKAQKLVTQILKKGKTPLIVGGTGLYFRTLLDGLFEAPVPLGENENLRKELLASQQKFGGNYLHDKLNKIDAAAAAKIHPNDLRRIVRALEVFYLTKKTFSSQKPNRRGIRDKYTVRLFFLDRERQELYARINKRVDRMLKQGLIAEVKRLQKRRLSKTASMALGQREVTSYLKNEKNLEEALETLKMNTRRYAKRQVSWFRHEKNVEFIKVDKSDKASATAKKIIERLRH